MTDRRLFLNTLVGGAAGAAILASGASASLLVGCNKPETVPTGGSRTGDSRPTGDLTILNGALNLENTAIYAYGVAGGSGLLSKGVLAVGGLFKGSHETHRDALTAVIKSLGGSPVEARKEYDLSAFDLKTEVDLLRLALFLEMKAARAYQQAVAQFQTRALMEAAARILGDEVSHATVLRSALGKAPVGFYNQLDEVGFEG